MKTTLRTGALKSLLGVAGLALAAACAPDQTTTPALRDVSGPSRWENEDSNGYLVLCKSGTPVGSYNFSMTVTGGGPGVALSFGNNFSLTTATTGDDCKWVWRDYYLEGGNSTITLTEEAGAGYEVKSWSLYQGLSVNGGIGALISTQTGGQSYTVTLAPTDYRYLIIENQPKTTTTPKCEDPTATNYGGPLPCTYPPPPKCEDPTATNYGGPLPCTYPPPPKCEDPTATNYGGPLPCTYPQPPKCEDPKATNYGGPLPCMYPPPPPTDNGKGCTPGYWKQKQHFGSWVGYTQNQDFDTVFGVNAFNPNLTLLQALGNGGGGIDALGRHAVAALLNSSNPQVGNGMTPTQVIALVKNAITSGNIEGAKNQLAALNERSCPLGRNE